MDEDASIAKYRELVHLIIDYRINLAEHDSIAYMFISSEIYKAEELGLLNVAQATDLRNKIRDRWYTTDE